MPSRVQVKFWPNQHREHAVSPTEVALRLRAARCLLPVFLYIWERCFERDGLVFSSSTEDIRTHTITETKIMAALKNIIVVGGSGKLGPSIVSAFASDSHFNISVLTRHSSGATFPSNVKVHRADDSYPEADFVKAFQGQDAVISTIATAAAPIQKTMINAAIKAGVKRFVPSEFGGDVLPDKTRAILPEWFEPKKEIVDYLKSKQDTLTWTAFVTGPFFDLAMRFGYMGLNIKEQKATLMDEGEVKWCSTRLDTVGLAVKNAMLIPEDTANKYLYINSFTTSQAGLLTEFEKATGTKWEVNHVSSEEERKTGRELFDKGEYAGSAKLINYVNTVDGYGGNYLANRESANKLLSLPEESLEKEVRKLVEQ